MRINLLIFAMFFGLGIVQAKGSIKTIELNVTEKGFDPNEIKVAPGTHVILNITRKTDVTCATEIVIKEKNINQALPLNKLVKIDLGILKKGEVKFACGMDMISGHILAE